MTRNIAPTADRTPTVVPTGTSAATRSAPDTTSAPTTRALLGCGIVAGPLYVVTGLAQALTRDGFDLRRHSLSLLSNGDLGWIQISNLVASGLLTVLSAVGLWRTLHPGRAGTWGPILLGIYGSGLVAAGAFRADPAYGFPRGTPDGPGTVSWHGLLHFTCGGIGFIALIAACVVFARRFAALGRRGWAAYSVTTGVLFFAAFAGIASGWQLAAINIGFGLAVVLGWTWIALLAADVRRSAR